jgi:IclR family acetate operon transcriptional repressor
MTSAVRTLQVCEALAQLQPIGVRELARSIDEPRSTVQRALETLEAAGWALRAPGGAWCLSTRPVLVAARAGDAGALRELSGPSLGRLAAATDESVRLWVRDGNRVAIVVSIESARPVRYVGPPPGTALPLHASAAGKAVLAVMPDAETDAVLSGSLEALTPWTVVDAAILRDQLTEIRARGFATTRNEAGADIGGVAAAVLDAARRPIGALSIALPMHRLTDELVDHYGTLAAAEATEVSTVLAGTAPSGPRS